MAAWQIRTRRRTRRPLTHSRATHPMVGRSLFPPDRPPANATAWATPAAARWFWRQFPNEPASPSRRSNAPPAICGNPSPLLPFHHRPLTPGARVPGVARYFGRAGAEATLRRGIEGRLVSRFSGPFVPIGEPEAETRGYVLFDAGLSLDLQALGGTVDVDLLNLADSRYPEIRASGYLNPGLPRTLRIAFRSGFGR